MVQGRICGGAGVLVEEGEREHEVPSVEIGGGVWEVQVQG